MIWDIVSFNFCLIKCDALLKAMFSTFPSYYVALNDPRSVVKAVRTKLRNRTRIYSANNKDRSLVIVHNGHGESYRESP